MEQLEINRRNEAIARFMGYKIFFINGNTAIVELRSGTTMSIKDWGQYHYSWDWLMPVVEKIEAGDFEIDICKNQCLLMNDINNIPEPITLEKLPAEKRFEIQRKAPSKIEAVFLAVSDYCLTQTKQ